MNIADILRIYQGSDGEATKALYARLEACGQAGFIAVQLFRACKASERAKVYRGGNSQSSYRRLAYDRKQWSLDNLCAALMTETLGIAWGWGVDREQPVHCHVLYIDLPTGQVSFHAGARSRGPDYPGQWDGMRGAGAGRVCSWVVRILGSIDAAGKVTAASAAAPFA